MWLGRSGWTGDRVVGVRHLLATGLSKVLSGNLNKAQQSSIFREFLSFLALFSFYQGAVFIGQGGGLLGVCHLLPTGLSKVLAFEAQISHIGVRGSGLSKVSIFGAQNSLFSVSKLSKSRIQVVGGW